MSAAQASETKESSHTYQNQSNAEEARDE